MNEHPPKKIGTSHRGEQPGEKAGMLAGDIVVDIGGTPIKDIYAYMEILSKLDSGDKVEVKVSRNNSEIVLQVQF